MSEQEKFKSKASTPICVRISPSELEKLKKDSGNSKKSIPSLLRETYFNTPPTKVLMNEKDVNRLSKEINRIGNNINQIAREINSGIRHGWNTSFENLSEQLKLLNQHYVLNYGVH